MYNWKKSKLKVGKNGNRSMPKLTKSCSTEEEEEGGGGGGEGGEE